MFATQSNATQQLMVANTSDLDGRVPVGAESALAGQEWDGLRRKIASRLDIAREYRDLGIVPIGRPSDVRGWLACRVDLYHLKDEIGSRPALINLRTGYFRSSSGSECLDLFEFATRQGAAPTYAGALRRYAKRARIKLPMLRHEKDGAFLEKVRPYLDGWGRCLAVTQQFRSASGRRVIRHKPGPDWAIVSGDLTYAACLTYRRLERVMNSTRSGGRPCGASTC